MRSEFQPQAMARVLAEETARLVSWDHIAVVLFDEQRNAWIIRVVMNRGSDPYVTEGQEVDPHGGLVGEAIQTGIPRILDTTASLQVPRFFAAERVESRGSLTVLPINSISRCYGALVVESRDVRSYTEGDVRTIQQLVDTVSSGLEIYALGDVVDNYVLLDETTGVANRRYFIERLHEEVHRAKDYGTDITVVMLSIDNVDEQVNRYGKDGFDFILQNVGRMVKSFVRPYDLVGRFDFNRFAVLLINTTSNEAYLWAEKVRKNIASNVINIDQRSFSVTVSAGVCSAVDNRTDVELMENANHVLGKAIDAGGNMVRVY
jgi:diguanylate cyclase (GGDEF)-like protein